MAWNGVHGEVARLVDTLLPGPCADWLVGEVIVDR